MSAININLARRHGVHSPLVIAMAIGLLCLVLLALAATHVYLTSRSHAQQLHNQQQRAALAAVHRTLAPLRAHNKQQRRLRAAHQTLATMHHASQWRASVLSDLGRLHPSGLRYHAVRFADGHVHLHGVAANASVLDALLAQLDTRPWFRRPLLQTQSADDEMRFTLQLRYQPATATRQVTP